MNPFERPDESDEAQALSAFADAVADGEEPIPESEIEKTFLRVQNALGGTQLAAMSMSGQDRAMLRENLMHTNVVPAVPALPVSDPVKTAEREVWSRRMDRWQAAVSLAAVIALLVGMSAFLYQRDFLSGVDDHDPTQPVAAFGQTVYDGTDRESWTLVPEHCVANGPVESDEYYADQSIDQWPLPLYTEAQHVSTEIGQKIQQTYLNYQRCYQDAADGLSASYTPVAEGTPASFEPRSQLLDSYFSDRARYVMLGDGIGKDDLLGADGVADVENFLCGLPRLDQILLFFPLPVNQPNDWAALDMQPDGEPNHVVDSFLPSDVYRMADGRFGVVIGSISTTELRDPSASSTSSDYMKFVAFVEKDGRYYIDEQFLIWLPDRPNLKPTYLCEAVS